MFLPGQGVVVSGANAGWTPSRATSASTLIGWFEAQASLVTLVSGNVSNAVNRIPGGANPLVPTSAGARPPFTVGGWGTGGKDSWTFDGTGHVLTAHGLASSVQGDDQPFSVLLVGQMLTLGSAAPIRSIWGFGNTVDPQPLHDLRLPSTTTNVLSSGRRDSAAVPKVKDAATALTTNRTMWSFVFNGTKSKLWVNGVLDTNLDGVSASADNDVGALTTLNTFSVGALARAGIAGFVNLKFGGMLVYAGALTGAEVALAEAYLERGHPL